MKRLLMILLAWTVLLVPGTAYAQGRDGEGGVLVRVNGDVVLDADHEANLVIAVNGDALIAGDADLVIVVDGTARMTGAQVNNLVVICGRADLQDGTVITNDVWLVDSDLTRARNIAIEGSINRGVNYELGRDVTRGIGLVLGFISFVALSIVIILSGLVTSAIAGRQVRLAGSVLTGDVGKTLLATIIIWIVLPLIAIGAFLTIIGIPTSLGILMLVLPMLGYLGYLVAGIRLGDALVKAVRGRVEVAHPYLASVAGLLILQIVGCVPVLGITVVTIAGIVGAGAISLVAWRAFRTTGTPDVAPS